MPAPVEPSDLILKRPISEVLTDVGAAAEFHRVAVERFVAPADLDDADEVAVFVAEELHDVGRGL